MTTSGWRVDLFLFVPQIDNEHREIVRRASDFCAALAERPKNEANVLLAKFIDSVRDHFKAEEELMLATGYEGYTNHRAEHARLMAQLFSLAGGFASGSIDFTSDAFDRFVGSWSDDHIRKADAYFAQFLHDTVGRKKRAAVKTAAPAVFNGSAG